MAHNSAGLFNLAHSSVQENCMLIGYTIHGGFSRPAKGHYLLIFVNFPVLVPAKIRVDSMAFSPYTYLENNGRNQTMQSRKAQTVARLGMLFALAMALSFFESTITPFLGLMPAMKLGLANIVVMYALVFTRRRYALALVVLKAAFTFIVRGATAGFLSLCGGGLSWLVLCILLSLPFPVTGYIFSVCGALAHNIGQLLGASVVLSSALALGYAPVLMAAGLVVGSITWWVARGVFPALKRFSREEEAKTDKILF